MISSVLLCVLYGFCCHRVIGSRDDNVGRFVEVWCEFVASFLLPQHVVANFYCALSNISVAVGVTFVVSLPFTFFLTSFLMAVN